MVRGSPPRRPAPPVTPREPHPKLWGAGGNLRPIPRCWSSGRAGFVPKPGTNRVKVSAAEGREFGVSKGGEGVKPSVGPAGRRSRPTALLWGRKGRLARLSPARSDPSPVRHFSGSPAENPPGAEPPGPHRRNPTALNYSLINAAQRCLERAAFGARSCVSGAPNPLRLKGFKGAELGRAGPCAQESPRQRKRLAGRWGEPGGSDLKLQRSLNSAF